MARTRTYYYPFDIGMENLLGEEFDFDLFIEDLKNNPPLPLELPIPLTCNSPELSERKHPVESDKLERTSEPPVLDNNSCGISPASPHQPVLQGRKCNN